jgi:hypothetical protein
MPLLTREELRAGTAAMLPGLVRDVAAAGVGCDHLIPEPHTTAWGDVITENECIDSYLLKLDALMSDADPADDYEIGEDDQFEWWELSVGAEDAGFMERRKYLMACMQGGWQEAQSYKEAQSHE